MPCFKGLAVSIHTPDGPIAEFSIQKQARLSRISSYIPVPPPKVPVNSTTGKPEQSTFAVSITLLTPGLNVPYSTPKPTLDDLHPKPRVVGALPGMTEERGVYSNSVPPYIPRTTNPNETIAAYIYFDGRPKEEVATLLRRGEETWVNSRWVSVPASEGGGLAEREFLFREVGLERWLNGLDLEGSKDQKAKQIERRQRRMERKKQQQRDRDDSDDERDIPRIKRTGQNGVLRYGGTEGASAVDEIDDDAGMFSSGSDSDDDPPQPEAAGQIKIALFRVLASGEIKRGEYSPQFDAHDDDDENANSNGNEQGDGDVDHTTSFAKPKTLDPKSISTQTVTGLDPPDSPYAVFTFFYRSEKQLQKMGILSNTEVMATPSTKRKTAGPDFSNLGPLKTAGTVGYSGYRDNKQSKGKGKAKAKDGDDADSDADDDEDKGLTKQLDVEVINENGKLLSPEDVKRQGELAEGVQKIKLKRQHSAEPLLDPNTTRKSPFIKNESPPVGTPQSTNSTSAVAGTPPEKASPLLGDDPLDIIASPYKRQRASVTGLDASLFVPPESGALQAIIKEEPAQLPEQKTELPASVYTGDGGNSNVKMEDDEEL